MLGLVLVKWPNDAKDNYDYNSGNKNNNCNYKQCKGKSAISLFSFNSPDWQELQSGPDHNGIDGAMEYSVFQEEVHSMCNRQQRQGDSSTGN